MLHLHDGHGHQIGGCSGINENRIFGAKPFVPFFFELTAIRTIRQDGIVLLQQLDNLVEVFPRKIVAHERVLQHGSAFIIDCAGDAFGDCVYPDTDLFVQFCSCTKFELVAWAYSDTFDMSWQVFVAAEFVK